MVKCHLEIKSSYQKKRKKEKQCEKVGLHFHFIEQFTMCSKCTVILQNVNPKAYQ